MHMAQLMPLPLTISCLSKFPIGFTFLVPTHPGSPGQRAVKRVCVYLNFIVVRLTNDSDLKRAKIFLKHIYKHYLRQCLQCFDAVGWAAGRASGL